ncbi:MAG: hypothetical protein VKK59_02225 [Vampirovibrionales bacterium]|nr:hypothetical protein [Vampirovibrionales bacterium]
MRFVDFIVLMLLMAKLAEFAIFINATQGAYPFEDATLKKTFKQTIASRGLSQEF